MKRALCIVLMLLAGGCSKKDTSQGGATNKNGGNPLSAPADYLGAVDQARLVAIRKVDLARLQNAINLFYAQEDRYPKDLNELIQKRYIPELPTLPAGARFDYNPQTGELKLTRQ